MIHHMILSLKTNYLENLRPAVFDSHRDRINEENRTSVVVLLAFTFAIIAANLVLQPLTGNGVQTQLIELGVYVVLGLVALLLLRSDRADYTALVYLLELPLLLFSLVGGTLFERDVPAFSFLFFLLVLPSIILDKPHHVLSFIWLLGIAFAVLDVAVKSPAVMERDMVHLTNACLISSAECLLLLSARIKNIDYAVRFEERTLEDPLTSLYNRAGAERYFEADEPGALLYVDLDNFKQVNDTFGHAEGDRVLRAVAKTLRRNFRSGDVIARMGGDEFAVFAKGAWHEGELRKRMAQTLSQLGAVEAGQGDRRFALSASIGCVVKTRGHRSFDELARLADGEMYRVKAHGKGGYRIMQVD